MRGRARFFWESLQTGWKWPGLVVGAISTWQMLTERIAAFETYSIPSIPGLSVPAWFGILVATACLVALEGAFRLVSEMRGGVDSAVRTMTQVLVIPDDSDATLLEAFVACRSLFTTGSDSDYVQFVLEGSAPFARGDGQQRRFSALRDVIVPLVRLRLVESRPHVTSETYYAKRSTVLGSGGDSIRASRPVEVPHYHLTRLGHEVLDRVSPVAHGGDARSER